MRSVFLVLGILLFPLGACTPAFDRSACPDATHLGEVDRKEFEWAAAESAYIFVGTLLRFDTDWQGYSGVATFCSDMEFSVDEVIAGSPASNRMTLEHHMVSPGLWVEERQGRTGLRLSSRVFHTGTKYILLADTRYRFCGKDSVNSVWLDTPGNRQAVTEAMPIPVTEVVDQPSVERREPMKTWNWRYDPRKFTGTVGLSAVVTQGGYPARVEVTKALFPELDQDVADWVRWKWHFRPAYRNCRPVPVEVALSIQVTDGVPEGMN